MKNCPFCGSKDVAIEKAPGFDAGGPFLIVPDFYYVACNSCSAEGPHNESVEGAVKSWDIRPQ